MNIAKKRLNELNNLHLKSARISESLEFRSPRDGTLIGNLVQNDSELCFQWSNQNTLISLDTMQLLNDWLKQLTKG